MLDLRRYSATQLLYHPDTHLVDIAVERLRVIGNRFPARGRIVGVVTGDHAEHQRRVADGARNRPYMVERVAQRNHPVAAYAAPRRLEPDASAKRRRDTNRGGGIGADCR